MHCFAATSLKRFPEQLSEGSELQLCHPKVTTLNFQRELFMIKGVTFSKPPKDFFKLVLTLIYNHGSSCISIISLLHAFFILKNMVTSLIIQKLILHVSQQTLKKTLWSHMNLHISKFSKLCLKPNTFKPQKLYVYAHNMQNVPLNQRSPSPLIQANIKSKQILPRVLTERKDCLILYSRLYLLHDIVLPAL